MDINIFVMVAISLIINSITVTWYYSIAKELNKITGPKVPMPLIGIICAFLILGPIVNTLLFNPLDLVAVEKVAFSFETIMLPMLRGLFLAINGIILVGMLIYHLQARENRYVKETNLLYDIIQIVILPLGFFNIPDRIDKMRR